jgi:uncharacterized iron-regulated membrane protein
MDDSDFKKLQREVQELRAEIRRTRHLTEGAVAIMAIGLGVLFPQLLVVALAMGALILFGILVSPLRRTIFKSLFQKRESDEYEG